MYTAWPTRLHHQDKKIPDVLKDSRTVERIKRFVRNKRLAPVNPFQCGDFEDFEAGVVGRPDTIDWTLYLQKGCWWSGYFGISEGVMSEFRDRLAWDTERRMRIFFEDENGLPFDPLWNEEYEKLKLKYGDLFSQLRGPKRLIVFVGSTAIGKSYWIEQLIKHCELSFRIVKNTTTRPLRNEQDSLFYNLVSKDQFLESKDANEFLEFDKHLENYYGSSLSEIRKVLSYHNGLFAITPRGAEELYRCRFELNVSLVVLKPANESVLRKNLALRGITDREKQNFLIKESEKFVLPKGIPHQVLELTRTRSDQKKVLELVSSLLK